MLIKRKLLLLICLHLWFELSESVRGNCIFLFIHTAVGRGSVKVMLHGRKLYISTWAWRAVQWQQAMHPADKCLRKIHNPYQPDSDLLPHCETVKYVFKKGNQKGNLMLLISCCRPKRMRGSLSGRSWPWAVSLTMGQASTPAAARVANPACPQGKTSDLCRVTSLSRLSSFLVYCCFIILWRWVDEKGIPHKNERNSQKNVHFSCIQGLQKTQQGMNLKV